MTSIKYIAFFTALLLGFSAQAQFHGGVKTGLNFSTLKGPLETDANGNTLESVDNFTGFHIGPTFSYAFTDRFGLRGELLYSKKGGKYQYDGAGFRNFNLDNNQGQRYIKGTTALGLIITHTNIDLPVSAWVRLGKLELSGGFYASLLLQKVGDGSMTFKWKNDDGTDGSLESFLNYNYNRDDAGEGRSTEEVIVRVNNRPATYPTIFGAYYDFPTDRGNLYKTLDYGLMGGAAFYISRTLYVGARLQYGLADLTNTNADVSRLKLDTDGNFITRNDKDYNFTIQASVGFSF